MKQKAFTLAEVLIILGIVGIVAAMTLPNLIGNYRKKIVETRLQRFYSVANNALKYSETENGSWDFWYFGTETKKWYDTYLAKYWKTIKTEVISGGYVAAYFPDGSLVIIKSGKDYFYYPEAKNLQNQISLEGNTWAEIYFYFALSQVEQINYIIKRDSTIPCS